MPPEDIWLEIKNTIEDFLKRYSKFIIKEGSLEFYACIFELRNILEKLSVARAEPYNLLDRPRADRLRNKLTHLSFMVTPDRLMNFLDKELTDFFNNPSTKENEYFENSDLYKGISIYETDKESSNYIKFVYHHYLAYIGQAKQCLEKFIDFSKQLSKDKTNISLYSATVFCFEQFLELNDSIQKMENSAHQIEGSAYKYSDMIRHYLGEPLVGQKLIALKSDNDLKIYRNLFRNASAHGGALGFSTLIEQACRLSKNIAKLEEIIFLAEKKIEAGVMGNTPFVKPTEILCLRSNQQITEESLHSFSDTVTSIEKCWQEQPTTKRLKSSKQLVSDSYNSDGEKESPPPKKPLVDYDAQEAVQEKETNPTIKPRFSGR